jgi:riboflavin synthase
MFTGLVEHKGAWAQKTSRGPNAEAIVRTAYADLELGESIAVDGCCLTVRAIVKDGFVCDVSKETLDRTTLGALSVGAQVNLERAMAVGERLGGHIVSGHVDGVGECVAIERVADATRVTFAFPKELARFIAEKGSVTVSGVSLTVNRVGARDFDVMLIPHTQSVTTLGALAVGTRVNLEVDLLARYVARLLDVAGDPSAQSGDAAWAARLEKFEAHGAQRKG